MSNSKIAIVLSVFFFVLLGFGCQKNEVSTENKTTTIVSEPAEIPLFNKVLVQPNFSQADYITSSAIDLNVYNLDFDGDGIFEKAAVYTVKNVPYDDQRSYSDIEYLKVYRWQNDSWNLIKEDQRAEDAGGGQVGRFCQVSPVSFGLAPLKDYLLVSKCHAWGGNEGYYLFGELPNQPGVFDDLVIQKAYLNQEKYLTKEGDKFLGLESVEVSGDLLVENYGVACASRPETYGHFGGEESGYCRTIKVLQVFDGSGFSVEPSVIE